MANDNFYNLICLVDYVKLRLPCKIVDNLFVWIALYGLIIKGTFFSFGMALYSMVWYGVVWQVMLLFCLIPNIALEKEVFELITKHFT